MDKAKAIELLGGSTAAAAEAVGVSYQAVDKWPDPLSRRIEDRVVAALVRLGRNVPSRLKDGHTEAQPEPAERVEG